MPETLTEQLVSSTTGLRAAQEELRAEVVRRHALLTEYATLKGVDALLLQRPANIAWLTCGAEVSRPGSCQSVASVFLMKEARCLLASNVDSPYLFDGPFNGLGFQLKERPWHEGLRTLLSDVCRGRKVASDAPVDGVPVVDYELSAFRRQMNEFEERHLRELGRDLAHCIEATCRTCDQGIPESELAAQLHHRLVRRQITPLQIRVASDGRSERYRNWTFSDAPIQRGATVSIFARQHGLHLGVTRTFAFESPDEETLKRHQHASLVLASAMYFSQVGWEMRETWSRLQRIYDKFGAAEEWRLAEQGMLTGYDACECAVTPGADVRLGAGNVVCWQPSVGGAMVGDSVLVRGEGQLCLTPASHWPTLSIEVKGTQIDVPDILRR